MFTVAPYLDLSDPLVFTSLNPDHSIFSAQIQFWIRILMMLTEIILDSAATLEKHHRKLLPYVQYVHNDLLCAVIAEDAADLQQLQENHHRNVLLCVQYVHNDLLCAVSVAVCERLLVPSVVEK
jgi:hypothetical protein